MKRQDQGNERRDWIIWLLVSIQARLGPFLNLFCINCDIIISSSEIWLCLKNFKIERYILTIFISFIFWMISTTTRSKISPTPTEMIIWCNQSISLHNNESIYQNYHNRTKDIKMTVIDLTCHVSFIFCYYGTIRQTNAVFIEMSWFERKCCYQKFIPSCTN